MAVEPGLFRRSWRSERGRVGWGGLLLLVLLVEVGGRLWPFSYGDLAPGPTALAPGWPHLMGTTTIGQDVLALVLRGTRRTVTVAATAAVGAALIGTLVGAAAGYLRGWVDSTLMRAVDLVLTVPPLALLVVLAPRLTRGGWLGVGLVLAATLSPAFVRVVRVVVLSAREQGYVIAARGLGASPVAILHRHVVPQTMPVVATMTTLTAATAILAETGLTYLGFGVVPPDTSLGALIARGQGELLTTPWAFFFPGATVVVIVVLLSLASDALHDAAEPRSLLSTS